MYQENEYLLDCEKLLQRIALRLDELQSEVIDKDRFIDEVTEHVDIFVGCRDKFLAQEKKMDGPRL